MAALDWGLLAVLALSLLIGAWRGLVFELLSLAGWVLAFFVARAWAAPVGAWLPLGQADAAWRPVAGFALLFVATVFACGLGAALGRRLMVASGMRPADRALGAVFGLARGAVLVLLLAWLAAYTPVARQAWWQDSRIAPWVTAMVIGSDAVPGQGGRHWPWQGKER